MDPRIVASRIGKSWYSILPDEAPLTVKELLKDSSVPSRILSKTRSRLFDNSTADPDLRSLSRALDYLAYGSDIADRHKDFESSFKAAITDTDIKDEPTNEIG